MTSEIKFRGDAPESAPLSSQKIAKEFDYSFPYLLDEPQETAKTYGAVCTPDFFGYNAGLKLQYRGRFDASRKDRQYMP